MGSGGGNLFSQLVNACYDRCAMIMTSNRGFGEWADIFGDSVVASSYRLREHANLLPKHLRNRTVLQSATPPETKRGPGRPRKEAAAPLAG